uniref:NADH dehydrogenase subunit 2 n=1 Tax=Tetraloides heterodactylus TaxID=3022721 RepID=UPI0028D3AF7B|nr:NADH dehydrogenase subunit 2 [Tetraloides heterodactylus]WMQ53220.1 NADH dehydrogenase subunit 2 [Tetraloides heterodactylus]
MLFPLSYSIFFFSLMMGTLLSISSSSWFGAWIGLELNLLSFIPLISLKKNYFLSEAALKYFLIQALASTIIIMSSCLIFFSIKIPSFLLLMSLLMKLGAAPFHFWFPQVMEGLSWLQAMILMTIQKLAPMYLISYLMYKTLFIHFIAISAIISSLVGALGGLNTMSLRKLMAFSSINHMSWMLVAISINEILWSLYFFFYSIISTSVVMIFFFCQAYTISDLLNSKFSGPLLSLSIPMSFLSLGGLPPFSGFIPKWMMIQVLVMNNAEFILFFLLFSSLLTLYFYLRLLMPFILLSAPLLSLNLKSNPNPFFFSISLFSMFNMLGLLLPLPFLMY